MGLSWAWSRQLHISKQDLQTGNGRTKKSTFSLMQQSSSTTQSPALLLLPLSMLAKNISDGFTPINFRAAVIQCSHPSLFWRAPMTQEKADIGVLICPRSSRAKIIPSRCQNNQVARTLRRANRNNQRRHTHQYASLHFSPELMELSLENKLEGILGKFLEKVSDVG